MAEPRADNGDDFFDRWHDRGDEALQILAETFTVPPSCEVFLCGLEAARLRMRAPVDVRAYARTLADNYQGGTE